MEAAYGNRLVFFVNGKKVVKDNPDPEITLLHYLREELHLTGVKSACGEGACGSCTVMVSHYDRNDKKTIHKAVTACLVPVCSLHGCAVITVEGVGSIRSGLHPIQDRLVENHGMQCGFCTPGMVMSMYALLRNNPSPSSKDIETALDGNLCRCTGYRPILQSFKSFSKEFSCGLGENCCKNARKEETETTQRVGSVYTPYDSSQEPIFPSELQVSDSYDKTSLMFEGATTVWYRPASLIELMALRKANPSAILVGGFTSKGTRAAPADGKKILISVTGVAELHVKEKMSTGLKLGAGLTVNEATQALRNEIDCQKGHTTKGLAAVLTLMERVASHQIRNMATLGGSIVANYSNSDVIVPLLAADAQLTIANIDGQAEEYPLISWCSSGQYKPCMNDSTILAVTIPFTSKHQHVFAFKQSSRAAMDRAIVNAGLSVTLKDKTNEVQRSTLCFGGLASTGIILAKDTAVFTIGKVWQETLVQEVMCHLKDELLAIEIKDKAEYRCSLALAFFLKFFHLVSQGRQSEEPVVSIGDISSCVRSLSSSTQVWEEVPKDQDPTDDVGRPKPHASGKQLATGEALFYTDIPKRRDELFIAMVHSTKAHAEIVSVDTSDALSMPGVVGYVGHKDVPGTNVHGEDKDELVFAVDKVECSGQLIGGVVAETESEARRAVKSVMVTYKELPPILTIEEAIKANSFYRCFGDDEFRASRGNTDSGFKAADHVKQGTIRIGAQDHFYMEPQFVYVVPLKEAGEYEVFLCSQHLAHAQENMADTLDIPRSKILIRQKRIGGSFGGKESYATNCMVLLPAAVAAYKFQRPVRCHLSREEDITTTGGRHPFLFDYKVGFMNDGKITAVEYALYNNGGSVQDMSNAIGVFSALATEGPFRIPNIQSVFRGCKTNTMTPAAMRGFGQPQALLASNIIIEHIAATLGVLPEEICEKNLLSDGDPYLKTCPVGGNLRKCWHKVVEQADVENIRHQLKEFNGKNRWKKRGMSVVPTVYPIGLPFISWFQALAHVNVYLDGSVLLSHGGIEIGQGINTKMIQIASRELGIPADRIHISEVSTSLAPNSTLTAASTGTDINGPAVMEACRKLNEGLTPIKKENPEGTWIDWIKTAHEARVPLSATGFFRHKEDETPTKSLANPLYYVYGAACTVVEVDCLTGEHVVLQTDIVMDIGQSLNPGIDIGQTEGAFMQGYGLLTMEEILYSPEGHMMTHSAQTYKIPTVADIPRKFNVTLLKNSDDKCKKPVYSSKAIGEPPLALGSSAFLAIKDAIGAARKESGLSGFFDLDSPATTERIRMACCDEITTLVTGSQSYSKPEWRA